LLENSDREPIIRKSRVAVGRYPARIDQIAV
jgi:hypothetical protein